jgi:hypothetical protein
MFLLLFINLFVVLLFFHFIILFLLIPLLTIILITSILFIHLLVTFICSLLNSFSHSHLNDRVVNVSFELINNLCFAMLQLINDLNHLSGHEFYTTHHGSSQRAVLIDTQQVQYVIKVVLDVLFLNIMLHNEEVHVFDQCGEKVLLCHCLVVMVGQ